jgi:hypothetical protein
MTDLEIRTKLLEIPWEWGTPTIQIGDDPEVGPFVVLRFGGQVVIMEHRSAETRSARDLANAVARGLSGEGKNA